MANESTNATLARAGKNLAQLFEELDAIISRFMEENEGLRNRVLADVSDVLSSHEYDSIESVTEALGREVDTALNAKPPATAAAVSAGGWEIGAEKGCGGADGGGVTATKGNTTVKGCMTGSLSSGPTGGGFEVTVSY